MAHAFIFLIHVVLSSLDSLAVGSPASSGRGRTSGNELGSHRTIAKEDLIALGSCSVVLPPCILCRLSTLIAILLSKEVVS